MLVGVDPTVREQMERTEVLHQIGHENVILVRAGVGQAIILSPWSRLYYGPGVDAAGRLCVRLAAADPDLSELVVGG